MTKQDRQLIRAMAQSLDNLANAIRLQGQAIGELAEQIAADRQQVDDQADDGYEYLSPPRKNR